MSRWGYCDGPILAVVDEREVQGLRRRVLQCGERLRHAGKRADAGTRLLPAIRCACTVMQSMTSNFPV